MKSRVFILYLLSFSVFVSGYSCKKINYGPVFLGTVIGFDQCTAYPPDSESTGYVIRIQKITDTGTVVIDSAMTYNLPRIFTFHPFLFENWLFTYRFPLKYTDTFKFKFSYINTPQKQLVYNVCLGDIFLGPVYNDIGGRQITITKIYGVVP